MGARDCSQLVVEHAGEREQVVALILQRDAYRADATRIDRFAPAKLCDDEIENLVADVQAWTGQREDVVGEPSDECSDVDGQGMRSLFGLPGERDPISKVRVLTCFPSLGLQLFTSRPGSLGDAGQGVGQDFALMLDVQDVAVTGFVAPGGLLSGAQSLARMGDRVVGIQTLLKSIEQVNAPGIGVAMFDCCSR